MELTANLRQAIKAYKAGDAAAFNVLYEESHKYIYTCVYRVMSGNDNTQDAVNDIMQDTYVEISKYISQLEDEEKFLSWAGTIANRKCFAYLKKSRKYVLLAEEDTTFENLSDDDNIIPEEVMQSREKQRLVRDIINNELTEMQKLCVIAYYYNEQKQSEIAQALGIPENTVKTNLSRAKAKIKAGVLDLEKNTGTRLYSAAPLLLLLLREDLLACIVPQKITEGVLATASSIATTASTATAAASTAAAGATATGAATTGATTATATAAGAAGAAGAQGAAAGAATGAKALLGKVAALSLKAKIAGSVAAVATVAVLGIGIGMAVEESKEDGWAEEWVEDWLEDRTPVDLEAMTNTVAELFEEDDVDAPEKADASETNGEAEDDLPWERAYKQMLSSYSDSEGEITVTEFDLYDFDGDGIPEILMRNGMRLFIACYNEEADETSYREIWNTSHVKMSLTVMSVPKSLNVGYTENGELTVICGLPYVIDSQEYTVLQITEMEYNPDIMFSYQVIPVKVTYAHWYEKNDTGEVNFLYGTEENGAWTELTTEESEEKFESVAENLIRAQFTDNEASSIEARFEEFKLYGNDTRE